MGQSAMGRFCGPECTNTGGCGGQQARQFMLPITPPYMSTHAPVLVEAVKGSRTPVHVVHKGLPSHVKEGG